MKLKKLLLGAATITTITAPVALVVACGSLKTYPQAIPDWTNQNYYDAKIVKWIDGDTPIVDVTGGTRVPTQKKDLHIRVSGIDTPELHVKNEATGKIDQLTTGLEFKYADAARIFADKLMPVGSTIRVTYDGSLSYGRAVGHIFYGKDFKQNFEVEILKAGLALPFINDIMEAWTKTNWQHYAYREMADAFNKAKSDKIGIFEVGAEKVSQVHGSTSLMNVTDYGSDKSNHTHHTIYYITKDLN